MGITYTKKNGRAYCYYQCRSASVNGYDTCPVKTIPAGEIEAAVTTQLRELLRSPEVLAKATLAATDIQDQPDSKEFVQTLNDINRVWDHLFPVEQARICRLLLDKARVTTSGLDVRLQSCGVASLIAGITVKDEAENV